MTPEQRRWALAFAILQLGPVVDLPGDATDCRQRLAAAHSIDSREDVLAYFKAKRDGDAYEIARLIAVAAWSVAPGFIDATTAWHVIWAAASLAKRTYGSWREYAETYEMIFSQITDGRASVEHEVERLLGDPASPWVELPWDLMGQNVKPRVLRVSCHECGAPRTRPSVSAYVYCDHCGALVDYDFAVVKDQPLAQPGPVHEALRAKLAPALDAARETGDVAGYRALQRELFDAWALACPDATPVRTRDPEYRARYVAWLAEGDTVAAFDAGVRALEAAMRAAIAGLAFAHVDGKPRVASEPFRVLADAVFAYESGRDALLAPVYAMHPDGAPRALQRRIGHSLFVQGWLPYLGEADAQALLDRTGLAAVYDELPPPEVRAMPCNRCGSPLEILAGARRVVCEHCGRLVDVVG
jgi:DNA-directed RNA polymerase subunit RPC12/RpoP